MFDPEGLGEIAGEFAIDADRKVGVELAPALLLMAGCLSAAKAHEEPGEVIAFVELMLARFVEAYGFMEGPVN